MTAPEVPDNVPKRYREDYVAIGRMPLGLTRLQHKTVIEYVRKILEELGRAEAAWRELARKSLG